MVKTYGWTTYVTSCLWVAESSGPWGLMDPHMVFLLVFKAKNGVELFGGTSMLHVAT